MNLYLAGFLILILSSNAQAASLNISSEDKDIRAGDTFKLSILLDPEGSNIYGAQYDLIFNNNLIEGIILEQGSLLSGSLVVNNVKNDEGKMEYAETRTGNISGVNSKGIISNMTFRAKNSGNTTIYIQNIKLVDDEEKIIKEVSKKNIKLTILKAEERPKGSNLNIIATVVAIIGSCLLMKKR